MTRPGTIIVLNGTSSSGKSSIVEALQNDLEEPYLDAGLDRFLWMLPDRYLERPLWDEVLGLAVMAGAAGNQLVRGMHRAIAALSIAGCSIVADHVLVEPAWRLDLLDQLAALQAYLVGVQCPLEILEARERTRKNRTLGQAKAQFPIVHLGMIYDLEVNTAELSVQACSEKIRRHILENPPHAMLDMRRQLI